MTKKTVPARNEISFTDTWDLTPLYAQNDEWEKEYAELSDAIQRYTAYQGRLGQSLDIFKEAFELDLEISRSIEKLYTYAHLKNDEDKGNQEYLAMYQKIVTLYTKASELSSFLTPEIQSLDSEVIKLYMNHPSMEAYRFPLKKIIKFKPHTRSQETEEVLAMLGEVSGTASQVFGQLDNVDLLFGTITDEKGEERQLSHGNFSTFLKSSDRTIRSNAFFTYYAEYDSHKNTLAATLASSIKKDYFHTKARKFKTCRQAALYGDNIPEPVYDNLISEVKNNLSPLFRYLDYRKERLGLDELHFYDTYVPLVKDIDFKLTYEEAVEITLASLKPLGEEYVSILKAGLTEQRWVDRYENKGKRSGAYSSGCYDSMPYILLNFENDNINSLYTLTHEAGHSMHTWYANRNQPYATHGYTIFAAEVASTFNEMLLSSYLLKKYSNDPAMQTYLLNREIDNFRATLYRQTMFAEFEKSTHEAVETGTPLTLEFFTHTYHGLLEEYFGTTLTIDPELDLEFLRIPHFYSPFYVYKYATGISAAAALARTVLEGGDKERNRYLDFLKLGGSMYPMDELKQAGVDMGSPKAIQTACAYFHDMVERFTTN